MRYRLGWTCAALGVVWLLAAAEQPRCVPIPVTTVECAGFPTEPTIWTIPGDSYAYSGLSRLTHTECQIRGDHLHMLRDMDGDEAPDLLVYSDCDAGTPLGDDHWLVHRNTGEGFAPEAARWELPAGYGLSTFETPENADCATFGDHHYALRDMDGDRAPDLVIPYGCDPTAALGETHWLVHTNVGDGFAATAAVWALPTGYDSTSFRTIADDDCDTWGDILHRLIDVDGDRRPELLLYSACDWELPLGYEHWLVHGSTDAGFDGAGERWCLPDGYESGAFSRFFDAECDTWGDTLFGARDLDGDRVLDLVVHTDCEPETTLGETHWWVHRGSASGSGDSAK